MSFSLPLGAETQLGRRIKNEPEDEGGYGRLQPFSTPDPNKRKRGVISAPAVADAPSKGHGKTASGSNRNQTFRGIKNEPSGDKYSDDDMKCGPRDGSSEDEPVKGRTTVGAEKKRISRQGCVPVPWAKKESDLARKLRNEGKSYEQISVELRGALGSIRTKSAVRQECHRQARRQMEWSSEDVSFPFVPLPFSFPLRGRGAVD